jgi:hypothetical protein
MFLLADGAAATYATVISSLGSSFQDIVTNTGTMISAVLPIGITIFGFMMLIGYGKKIFTKITGGGGH